MGQAAHPRGAELQAPTRAEIAFGLVMASTSGLALMAHAFGPVPLRYIAPFVVMPSAAVLLGTMSLRRRADTRLHALAGYLMSGALWGLIATGAYDVVRPLLVWTLGLDYDPYRAMPIFGHLMTDQPKTAAVAIVAGWAYHFWNGISFGMMFAIVRPRGPALAGLAWGWLLEALMMATYPTLLDMRLDNPGFLITSIVGHGVWGLVLGYGLQRWGRHA